MQALFGQTGVQGQIGSASFENAQDSDDCLGRSGQINANNIARLDAAGDERMGELVGAGVQLAVSEGGRVVQGGGHGDGVGRGPGLGLKQLDH